MAPPLLVVTPTKGHVGWDEPVQDPIPGRSVMNACLTAAGAFRPTGDRTRVTGVDKKKHGKAAFGAPGNSQAHDASTDERSSRPRRHSQ